MGSIESGLWVVGNCVGLSVNVMNLQKVDMGKLEYYLYPILGDAVVQEFRNFVNTEARDESFPELQPSCGDARVDTFFYEKMSGNYPRLWEVCRKLLTLSHGQATVERGFSVNKEVETTNMADDTYVVNRAIIDFVNFYGGIMKVPITKELLTLASSARVRQQNHRIEQQQKRSTEEQLKKKQQAEEELLKMRKKMKLLEDTCEQLLADADRWALRAEDKSGTEMSSLITKSNMSRKRSKEKRTELEELKSSYEKKMEAHNKA